MVIYSLTTCWCSMCVWMLAFLRFRHENIGHILYIELCHFNAFLSLPLFSNHFGDLFILFHLFCSIAVVNICFFILFALLFIIIIAYPFNIPMNFHTLHTLFQFCYIYFSFHLSFYAFILLLLFYVWMWNDIIYFIIIHYECSLLS